jgi:thiamine biosynthesis protein ThiI
MKEIILIKDGELALKGLNRSSFEDMLVKNIRRRIKPFGMFDLKKSQSTVIVTPLN